MSTNDPINTKVTFHGIDIQRTLQDNPDVYRAVWEFCGSYLHASIRIDVAPRIEKTDMLEWPISIASPAGRRTVIASQQQAAGPTRFDNQ